METVQSTFHDFARVILGFGMDTVRCLRIPNVYQHKRTIDANLLLDNVGLEY